MNFIRRREFLLLVISLLLAGSGYLAALDCVRGNKLRVLEAAWKGVPEKHLDAVSAKVPESRGRDALARPERFTSEWFWALDVNDLELARRSFNKAVADAIGRGAEVHQAPESPLDILFGGEQLACLVLGLWGGLIHLLCRRFVRQEHRLLGAEPDPINERARTRSDEYLSADELAGLFEKQWRYHEEKGSAGHLWPRASTRALERFQTTRSIAVARDSALEELQNTEDDFEASLATERYIQFAVPTIGFAGTVRGMLLALSQATSSDKLPDVAVHIGTAFTSTLFALALALLLVLSRESMLREFGRLIVHTRHALQERVLTAFSGSLGKEGTDPVTVLQGEKVVFSSAAPKSRLRRVSQ